ncbi:MAG: helix-turn-helix domain-containing protein [Candidatus Udaeobacter sp.]
MTRAPRSTSPTDPPAPEEPATRLRLTEGQEPDGVTAQTGPDELDLNPDPIYDLKQAALYTNMPEEALRALVRSGRIPFIAYSERRLRVRRSVLEAYIAESTRPATRQAQS